MSDQAIAPAPPATRTPEHTLARLLALLDWADPVGWAAVLAPEMQAAHITGPLRRPAFLANCTHETGGGRCLVESLNYSVAALLTAFGRHRITVADAHRFGRTPTRAANQEAIANALYGGEWGRNLGNTQPGDGWRYRGRGLIQLTGRANYARFGATAGIDFDTLPALLETRAGAAASACAFWTAARCNALADTGDIAAVRRRVNGGSFGLAQVEASYRRARDAEASAS